MEHRNGSETRSLAAAQSTQVSASLREANAHLAPATRGEFATELVPCLALTSGIGMTEADQDIWLEAAHRALDDIPADLLRIGAKAAMRKADHPSKIVPAIIAEVAQSMEWRRQSLRYARARAQEALPAPIETAEAKAEREEVAELMAGLARKLSANA